MQDETELCKESYDKHDYEGHLRHAKLLYQKTQTEEDKLMYEEAKRDFAAHKEIEEIIKAEKDGYFAVLGITDTATLSDINRAFREKASRCHPNRTRVRNAAHATRILNKAYFELNTEEKLSAYKTKHKAPKFFQGVNNDDAYPFISRSFVFTSPCFRSSTSYHPPYPFDAADPFDSLYHSLYSQTRFQRARRPAVPQTYIYFSYILLIIIMLISLL